MKTLNEVIKLFEAYSRCRYDLYEGPAQSTVADALQYLLGYKEMLINVENEPLDWYELKLMKGKPVWVEADDGKYKGWFIVGNFFSWFEKEDFDAHVNLYRSGGAMEMSKEMYGSYWQAYKKERK